MVLDNSPRTLRRLSRGDELAQMVRRHICCSGCGTGLRGHPYLRWSGLCEISAGFLPPDMYRRPNTTRYMQVRGQEYERTDSQPTRSTQTYSQNILVEETTSEWGRCSRTRNSTGAYGGGPSVHATGKSGATVLAGQIFSAETEEATFATRVVE